MMSNARAQGYTGTKGAQPLSNTPMRLVPLTMPEARGGRKSRRRVRQSRWVIR
jgi:hypothetical protein